MHSTGQQSAKGVLLSSSKACCWTLKFHADNLGFSPATYQGHQVKLGMLSNTEKAAASKATIFNLLATVTFAKFKSKNV